MYKYVYVVYVSNILLLSLNNPRNKRADTISISVKIVVNSASMTIIDALRPFDSQKNNH